MSLVKKYNKLLERGLTKTDACISLGIARSTMYDLLKREEKLIGHCLNKEPKVSLQANPELKEQEFEGPRILTLDIETAPVLGNVWQLFQQNVGLNQIERDWYVLSWSAKWHHEDEVMYEDKSESWDNEDDKELLQGIWNLLDSADIILTQNGKRFDEKKLNARFIINGLSPPSSYRHIDTLQIAKRHFGFTSNKLEYMTDKLCKKYKKQKHGKFAGFELWKECLAGNPEAWAEMQTYNIYDVLSLEELYVIMRPWFKSHFNMNVYRTDEVTYCKCGSSDFSHNGYHYTNLSKFDRFACNDCGAEIRGNVNLIPKSKRDTLGRNV